MKKGSTAVPLVIAIAYAARLTSPKFREQLEREYREKQCKRDQATFIDSIFVKLVFGTVIAFFALLCLITLVR